MPRLPKFILSLTVASCLAIPGAVGFAMADDTAPPAGAAAPAPTPDNTAPLPPPGGGDNVPAPAPANASDQERKLRNDVDAYFHYAWIGRYDLASQFADAINGEASDPALFLSIMESTARRHDANMGYIAQLMLFDAQPQCKDATDKLLVKVQQSNFTLSDDPNFIAKTIRDMSASERAYENHLPILRKSGENAVPVILEFLQLEDEQHLPYRGTARRALVDIGRVAVNPLLAALDTNDQEVLLIAINSLRDLGYDVATPYLARIANLPDQAPAVRDAASSALAQLGVDPQVSSNPAAMFYNLAQQFYYGKAAFAQVIAKPGATPETALDVSYYWTFDQGGKGLLRHIVPAAIFNDMMTMRCCESAIALKGSVNESIALWITADNKREVDLPAGATDDVNAGQPAAHFYSVSVGINHLNDALRRTLHDHNTPVTLKLTQSMGEIVGPNLVSEDPTNPLIDALRYPDKLVRFEAAFAMAEGLPTKSFSGQELVIPLMVQAVAQGGKGDILVLAKSQDEVNLTCDALRKLGYEAAGGATPGEAADAASNLPSVDVVLIARGVSADAASRMITVAKSTPVLAGAVRVVMQETKEGPLASQAIDDTMLSIVTDADGTPLKDSIEAARTRGGSPALDDKASLDYSLRSVNLLAALAINHNQILDVSGAQPGLLAAINDPRAELSASVGFVLSLLPTKAAQQGILAKSLDSATPGDLKVSLYKSLASSAKTWGNLLDGASVEQLQSSIAAEKNVDIRAAAAEARGALNLPTDQAARLILSQAQK